MLHSSATNIFIPTNDEIEQQKEANCTKQFALYVKDVAETSEKMVVSAAFSGDNPDPFAVVEISDEDDVDLYWLEKHNFLTRETKIEELFVVKSFLEQIKGEDPSSAITCLLYSRQIPRVQQGG